MGKCPGQQARAHQGPWEGPDALLFSGEMELLPAEILFFRGKDPLNLHVNRIMNLELCTGLIQWPDESPVRVTVPYVPELEQQIRSCSGIG